VWSLTHTVTTTFYYYEQVANLWCAQVNSASYPSRDAKWVVAYGLRGEGQCNAAMDGRIMRCGIISSCQSAATSEIVKRSWACVHREAALCQVPDLYHYCYCYYNYHHHHHHHHHIILHYYLCQVNEVNGGDTVFVQCLCVRVCVCLCVVT